MKYIFVAKDAQAMEAIDYDTATPEQIWEYILSEEEFKLLFSSGIVNQLNELCGTMIDDFEDELISDEDCLRKSIVYLTRSRHTFENQSLIDVLTDMFEKALRARTAVYFSF